MAVRGIRKHTQQINRLWECDTVPGLASRKEMVVVMVVVVVVGIGVVEGASG